MASSKGPNMPNETESSDKGDGPLHVGIIMDGNGRWAAERSLPRVEGHRRGMEAVREAVRAAPEFGVGYLTLFSFSSENWARPETEVEALFGLLRIFIQSDLADRRPWRALTDPAWFTTPEYSKNFSVSVVFPASGWLMIANVRRRSA